jgi:hypothetical protein
LLELDEDWEFNDQTLSCIIQTSEETIVDYVDRPIANLKALNMQRKKRQRKKPLPNSKTNSLQTLKLKEKVMHLTNITVVQINDWLSEEHKSQTSNIVNLVKKEPFTKQRKSHHKRRKTSKKRNYCSGIT